MYTKRERQRRAARNLVYGTLAFIFFIGVMGLVGYFTIPYKATFQSGASTISYERPRSLWSYEPYKPGDAVDLTVSVESGAVVSIITVKLKSSIKGWENVTLYSGGGVSWGKVISYESGTNALESKPASLVIPDYVRELGLDVIRAEVEVYYVYAKPIGTEFMNLFNTDNIPVEISLVQPGPPNELILMVVIVVLPIAVALFLVKRHFY